MKVTFLQRCALFSALFEREWLVYKKRIIGLMVNFLGIQAFSFAFVQGYIKPLMYFGLPMDRRALLIFAGSLIMLFMRRSFNFATALFFDLHKQRHVWFQRMSAPPAYVYAARALFATIFTWFLIIFFIPIAKIVLNQYLDISRVNWPVYVIVFLLISLMMVSYAFMWLSIVNTSSGITKVRVRLNEILMWLGAFNATWLAMYKSWHVWGYIALCNPLTYATESLRHALSSGSDLLPFSVTLSFLMVWSVLFFAVGVRVFTKKAPR